MTIATAVRTPADHDTLRAALARALGRALGLVLLLLVLATAVRGPLPDLTLVPSSGGPVSQGPAVVLEPAAPGAGARR